MSPDPQVWAGRRVFLTGHTGFKGSWLALWLSKLGAEVHGFALCPPTHPSLFEAAGVERRLASHRIADIRDADELARAVATVRPDIVFHLAAQPLVRASYRSPVETYATNVMGTVHLLEAVRACGTVRAVVSVTTDKCYANNEWVWGYREHEPLGGRDPYSSSKACAELVTSAYRDSFLKAADIAVASARAGNVIGGGDWATDRLVPDFLRSADSQRPLEVRYPHATRPWQHVLEPLGGYIVLAERLWRDGAESRAAEAFNFGPNDADARPVAWILDRLASLMPGTSWINVGDGGLHEAGFLKLDSSKARHELGWSPRWGLDEALQRTVAWHAAWRSGGDLERVSIQQIDDYERQTPVS